MRKLLGYIPLDPGEDKTIIAKETDVLCIEGCWYKLSEVWIPGVAIVQTNCGTVIPEKKDEYKADPLGKLCINCGKPRDAHVFYTICPKP